MHKWLSGGVSPCQGEGRGFESRLVLYKKKDSIDDTVFSFCVCKKKRNAYKHAWVPFSTFYFGFTTKV